MALCCLNSIGLAQEIVDLTNARFLERARIDFNANSMHYKSYQLSAGDFTVFELMFTNSNEEGNVSDTRSYIVFQINPNQESFELTAKSFADSNAFYIQSCRCADRGIHPLQFGKIRGTKTNGGAWEINVDVESIGSRTGKKYKFEIEQKLNHSE